MVDDTVPDDSLRADFGFLTDRVKGVLLFGSRLRGATARDIDLCVVTGLPESWPILFEIFQKVDVRGRGYDVWLFEELPLYMRHEVIREHRVLFSRDLPALYEYLYFQRKLSSDVERRRRVAES